MYKKKPTKKKKRSYELYKRVRKLGKGAFGTAFLVKCLSDD